MATASLPALTQMQAAKKQRSWSGELTGGPGLLQSHRASEQKESALGGTRTATGTCLSLM